MIFFFAVAAYGEFPWQASIKFLGSHSCGGSLLSSRYLENLHFFSFYAFSFVEGTVKVHLCIVQYCEKGEMSRIRQMLCSGLEPQRLTYYFSFEQAEIVKKNNIFPVRSVKKS